MKDYKIQEFIDKLASSDPVPGGGSVAALCGSLAASLGSMVGNLTIGKKKYEEVEPEIKGYITELNDKSDKLLALIDEDVKVFGKLMEAYKLPKESEAEKFERTRIIEENTKLASMPPLNIAVLADSMFEAVQVLVEKGNPMAQTDGLIAAILIRASVLSALYNVKINLAAIDDEIFKSKLQKQVKELEDRANQMEPQILSLSKY